jgi:hypothetical protein
MMEIYSNDYANFETKINEFNCARLNADREIIQSIIENYQFSIPD